MTAKEFLRVVYEVARKDVLLESRTKSTINSSVVFASLIVVVFSFAFVRRFENLGGVGRGALWIAFVFSGTVGMTRSASVEESDSAIEGLMLVPVDRSAIYVGKVLSTSLFVSLVGSLSLVLVTIFLDYPIGIAESPLVIGVVVVASLGFSSVGVLMSILSSKSNLSETVLPILLIPLMIPVLLSGIELTRVVTEGGSYAGWLRTLAAYDGIVFLAGLMTFGYVLEE
ncbi:heme exporter protein CcmB [Halorutilales archaeon Cl-col2-1]